MSDTQYTAITFAPVQGFIEKSRKLRDLYGSSYILSHLADEVCKKAEKDKVRGLEVISPALIDVAKGTPNQIVIKGDFPEQEAREIFQQAWGKIVDRCRSWIEEGIPQTCRWSEEWNKWRNYAWEFFWVQGADADEARRNLTDLKRSRAWTGINWKGESSTLSGADAIAYPDMTLFNPKTGNYQDEKEAIERFYHRLSQRTGEIIESSEQLSIPELIKRLVTMRQVAKKVVGIQETPETFRDLNRLGNNHQTGWFQGDGDSFGAYLKSHTKNKPNPDELSKNFSLAMRNWANTDFSNWVEKDQCGRVVYAGGDDFLGIFYHLPSEDSELIPLTATECLERFYEFPEVWQKHGQPVTVSVGFVWAFPGVPQRDVLQHCRRAEKAAKDDGKDRIAIRILFNSGNHLEWSCPWDYLKKIFTGYCDRSGGQNWTHIYNDIAALKSRHAFDNQGAIAQALWEIYFPEIAKDWNLGNDKFLWNIDDDNKQRQSSGILGKQETLSQSFTDWFINLAKVGFHLYV